MTLPLAQKVRLWFAGGCQALALILSLVALSDFNYSALLNVTAAGGDLITVLAWVFILEVAVATLASITLYRFLKPRTVTPPVPPVTPRPTPPDGYGRGVATGPDTYEQERPEYPPTQPIPRQRPPDPPGPFQTQGYHTMYPVQHEYDYLYRAA